MDQSELFPVAPATPDAAAAATPATTAAAPVYPAIPLAERMRPKTIDDFVGQGHVLACGSPLHSAIVAGRPHSMVLWGPPGSGKTTLGRMVASYANAQFITLSAVLAGVSDIRQAIVKAKTHRQHSRGDTVLFIDEVHRFNKAQQDAFLPYIEDGTLLFIGATTENPSFALDNALLSRARVYVLKALSQDDIIALLAHAQRHGFDDAPEVSRDSLARLAAVADDDARRALNLLEIAAGLAVAGGHGRVLHDTVVQAAVAGAGVRRYDNRGDIFYEQISVLHKAIRGSSADAGLYWLGRMLDGGCDPAYLARRLTRIASEDIGNADPSALRLCLDAWQVQERLGSPEGELALAQAVVYLACAPKSNAVYRAFQHAMGDVEKYGDLPTPLRFRTAPTRLMRDQGYGKGYRYAHDEAGAYCAGESYFPDTMPAQCYYQPSDRGDELRLRQLLQQWRDRDRAAKE